MFSQHRFREDEDDKRLRLVIQKDRERDDGVNKDDFNEFQKALEDHNAAKKRNSAAQSTTKSSAAIARTDLEVVAKKRKTDEMATRKPVFLTKAMREQQALDRLKAKSDEKQAAERATDGARRDFERRERSDRRGDRDGRRTEREKAERKEERELSKKDRETFRERELIKYAYLGKKKNKKVVIPPSQKFKFSFDWEACEDTSVEHNNLYDLRHKINMQFGRGFMAGIDRREQRKNAVFYDELMKDRDEGRTDSLLRKIESQNERTARQEAKSAEALLEKRHWSEKKTDDMTDRDWRIFKEDKKIVLRAADFKVPNPLRAWRNAEFTDEVETTIVRAGYKTPLPLQAALVPLRHLDVFAISEQGSGKGSALFLPLVRRLIKYKSSTPKHIRAIIMTNTLEHAQKVYEEGKKFVKILGFRIFVLDVDTDVSDGADVYVSTPAIMAQAIADKKIDVSECNDTIVREADKIVQNEKSAKKLVSIMKSLPKRSKEEEEGVKRRTVVLATATSNALEDFCQTWLTDAVCLTVGDVGGGERTITQKVEWMDDEKQKHSRVRHIVTSERGPLVVVCNSKRNSDTLAKEIGEAGVSSTVLHAGKTSDQLESNLRSFANGNAEVLVITHDMVPRVQMDTIKQIINFDMCASIDKYTVRVGMTGRNGKSGTVTSFVGEDDAAIFYEFKKLLKACKQDIPRKLAQHSASRDKIGR